MVSPLRTSDFSISRSFLPADFQLESWTSLSPWFENLVKREVSSSIEFENWLRNRSELESFLEEEMGWRYIRSSCDTTSEKYKSEFAFFIEEIEPQIQPISNELDKKLVALASFFPCDIEGFELYLRSVKKSIELYREENIPLLTQIQLLQQEYGQLSGAMTVQWQGEELTLQQAGVLLQNPDTSIRKAVWHLIQQRRAEDRDKLNELYSQLIGLRTQVAQNCGFDNYRDYMHVALGRFDYGVEDCLAFHDTVEKTVKPIVALIQQKKCQVMGSDKLRPWDLSVDAEGREPLVPFLTDAELLARGIKCLDSVSAGLGSYLDTMSQLGHLDLGSRKGKAPGGYNYPLDEIGLPFVFMNATSTLRDMVTLLHEAGHAIHSVQMKQLPLEFFKHTPSEAAELASMSMELLSMDYWAHYFPNPEDLIRAKMDHLEDAMETLTWVATIDAFQHWIYTHPQHSIEERELQWGKIYDRFHPETVDWGGLEAFKRVVWQKQLHLFEVPFYYIEYGFAQLGAFAVWRNYKANSENAIKNYLKALSKGYSVSLPKIYETAGIKFDFSPDYIDEVMRFVKSEWQALS